MALTAVRLVETQFIPNSETAVITNIAGKKTYVQGIYLYNAHTANVTVEIWNVPDNVGAVGTASDVNKKISLDLAIGETMMIDLGKPGWILQDENDTVQVKASVASVANIEISGFEE